MKRSLCAISALALAFASALALSPSTAFSDESAAAGEFSPDGYKDEFDKNWLNNYEGTIGNREIRMTLVFYKGGVEGEYFYVDEFKDTLRLKGSIGEDRAVSFDEIAFDGKTVSLFKGRFTEEGEDYRGGPSREKIAGTWQKAGAADELPFSISTYNGTGGTLLHRYAVAGADDDKLIHEMALKFQTAVVQGDRNAVAGQLRYPIKVNVRKDRLRTIRTKEQLIAQYDNIFTQGYRDAIAKAIPKNMFVKYSGIMLGNGEVWFGDDGTVIALNNGRFFE